MAAPTLNATNLEKLGAARLAELVLELAKGDAAMKRRLRLELGGPSAAKSEVAKRLTTLAKAKSFVDRQGARALAADLDAQRAAIVDKITPSAPEEAAALLWRLVALAEPLFNRVDDSNGAVGDVLRMALNDLAAATKAAKSEPIALAKQIIQALEGPDYGLFDGLIMLFAESLGAEGLGYLKQYFKPIAAEMHVPPPEDQRVVVARGLNRVIYRDEMIHRHRVGVAESALLAIADAEGDVDAFAARFPEEARDNPYTAVQIAERYMAVGRAADALAALDKVTVMRSRRWVDLRIEALLALDRKDDAQAQRWDAFLQIRTPEYLRSYLKDLPDFEDVEVEEAALTAVEADEDHETALAFLVAWPALDRAAALVLRARDDWDGDHYSLLTSAAEALSAKHPLAATILLRAMIDFSLIQARSSRYGHAARHLRDCAGLAARIEDWSGLPNHEAYFAAIRAEHGRKSSFWSRYDP